MHLSSPDVPRQMYTSTVSDSSPTQEQHHRSVGGETHEDHASEGPLNPETLTDTHLHDVGLHPPSYYNSRLPYPAAFVRNLLLPLVKWELPLLEKIQQYHSHWLTLYFLYTANVGSHTFYVIMLPFGVWLGSLHFTRDLVIVLGLGIYITGAVKDLLCLPRPHSPPLERLTMSHYTAKEYGCPSSHSANATSVCIILFLHVQGNSALPMPTKYAIYLSLVVYWLTMVVGRLYCGMHGLVDVTTGIIIGAFTVMVRLLTKNYWDYTLLSNNETIFRDYFPILLAGFYYSLIYFHPTPIEPCPCFEDSVAFISVLLGLDLAICTKRPTYIASEQSLTLMDLYEMHPVKVYYRWAELGPFWSLVRVFVGVSLVVIWKSFAKAFFTFLIGKLRGEKPPAKNAPEEPFAFIPRTDTKIFVKFISYSGIPVVAWGSAGIFKVLGI